MLKGAFGLENLTHTHIMFIKLQMIYRQGLLTRSPAIMEKHGGYLKCTIT